MGQEENPGVAGQPQPQQTPQNINVSQPSSRRTGKGGKKGLFIVLILVLVMGVGAGLFFLGRARQGEVEASPTPFVSGFGDIATPEPTSSPEPADRADVEISVLNGTGIAGEASLLQGKLRDLGYTEVEAGNATNQDNEATTVTFSSSLSESIVEEITELLEETYKTVKSRTSSSVTVDVEIVTGLRKGATAKPEATATPESTASPTSTASPSSTPTQ